MSFFSKLIGRSSKPLPCLDTSHPLVIELSAALRALDAMPISTAEERARWYEASDAFQQKLITDWISIYDSLPHDLEHYLVDVEIRAEDEGYARYQRDLLAALLAPN